MLINSFQSSGLRLRLLDREDLVAYAPVGLTDENLDDPELFAAADFARIDLFCPVFNILLIAELQSLTGIGEPALLSALAGGPGTPVDAVKVVGATAKQWLSMFPDFFAKASPASLLGTIALVPSPNIWPLDDRVHYPTYTRLRSKAFRMRRLVNLEPSPVVEVERAAMVREAWHMQTTALVRMADHIGLLKGADVGLAVVATAAELRAPGSDERSDATFPYRVRKLLPWLPETIAACGDDAFNNWSALFAMVGLELERH